MRFVTATFCDPMFLSRHNLQMFFSNTQRIVTLMVDFRSRRHWSERILMCHFVMTVNIKTTILLFFADSQS